MNNFIYLLFFSIFFLDFMQKGLHLIPRQATWIPEILSIITFLLIAIFYAFYKKFNINFKYLFIFTIYFIAMLISMALNETPAKDIIIGSRIYLKALPFFLLPMVYFFSEDQIKKQLNVLLLILMVQFPLTFYQRFIQYKGHQSGDPISGTLVISSVLSIVLVCAIGITFSMYLNKRLKLKSLLLLVIILFLPTTLNETKGTLFLLPFAIILPIYYFHDKKGGFEKYKKAISILTISLLMASIFFPMYNMLLSQRLQGQSITSWYKDKNKIVKYFYKNEHEKITTDGKHIRRGDAISLMYKSLSTDIFKVLFGLGIGKVADSYFGEQNDKNDVYKNLRPTMLAVTQIFWELGLVGLIVHLSFFIIIFKDAVLVRQDPGILGPLALGWISVLAIMATSMLYKNIIQFNVIIYLFWYYSGIMASRAFMIRERALN